MLNGVSMVAARIEAVTTMRRTDLGDERLITVPFADRYDDQ
jgi:hypothetical protein